MAYLTLSGGQHCRKIHVERSDVGVSVLDTDTESVYDETQETHAQHCPSILHATTYDNACLPQLPVACVVALLLGAASAQLPCEQPAS